MGYFRRRWRQGRREGVVPVPSFVEEWGFVEDGLEALYAMEQERRNLLLYSENLGVGSSVWSVQNLTATSGQDDPFGRANAYRIAGATTSNVVRYSAGLVVRESTTYTMSFYAKDIASTDARYAIWNLTTSGWLVSQTSFLDQLSTDEWTRVEVTFTIPAGTTSIRPEPIADSNNPDLYMYGFQINEGDTALPYVPTTNKQALYDYSGNGRHATRGSVGSAFICPVGEKHLSLPGTVATNEATAPFTTDSFADELEVVWKANQSDQAGSNGTFHTPFGTKSASAGDGWMLYQYVSNGNIRAFWRDSGGTEYDTGQIAGDLPQNEPTWVRVRIYPNDGGVWRVTVEKSGDGSTWSAVGEATGAGPSAAITNRPAGKITIGSVPYSTGTNTYKGSMYRLIVRDGAGGTKLCDFNPNRDAHGDVSRFTSSTTGEVWTISQATASDTNDPTWTGEGADFDGVDDYYPVGGYAIPNAEHTVFAVSNQQFDATIKTLVSQRAGSTPIRGNLEIQSSDRYSYAVRDDAGNLSQAMGSPGIADGSYHMVTGRRANSRAEVIVDDGTVTAGAVRTFGAISEGELNIGRSALTASGFVSAVIVASGFYSRALSDDEVAENYAASQSLLAERGVSI